MSNSGYDFCIGTDNPRLGRAITGMLNGAGFYSSGTSKNVSGLLRTLRSIQPWLAVIDTALPPGNIEQLASIIKHDILSAAVYINTTGIDLDLHVQLKWPVDAPVLVAVSEAVCNEFAHKKKLQQEIADLQRKLGQRKQIEKAKGLIAEYFKLNEDQAYHLLRKASMEQSISLATLARHIIEEPAYLVALSPHR